MRRLIPIAAGLMILAASCSQAGPIVPPTGSEPGMLTVLASGRRVVALDGTLLRQGPALDAAVLDRLQAGDVVQLAESSADGIWYRVVSPEGAATGWLLADLVVEPATTARVTATGLNIRGGPGVDYPIVATASENEVLDVLAQVDDCDWLKVLWDDGIAGWVAGRYVVANLRCEAIPKGTRPAMRVSEVPGESVATLAEATDLTAAPVPILPADRAIFNAVEDVQLAWTPVRSQLAENQYYLITLTFTYRGKVFTDHAYSTQAEWSLADHAYLIDLADNGRFVWSVYLLQAAGFRDDGVPVGTGLSAPSVEREFTVSLPSGGRDEQDSKVVLPPTPMALTPPPIAQEPPPSPSPTPDILPPTTTPPAPDQTPIVEEPQPPSPTPTASPYPTATSPSEDVTPPAPTPPDDGVAAPPTPTNTPGIPTALTPVPEPELPTSAPTSVPTAMGQ